MSKPRPPNYPLTDPKYPLVRTQVRLLNAWTAANASPGLRSNLLGANLSGPISDDQSLKDMWETLCQGAWAGYGKAFTSCDLTRCTPPVCSLVTSLVLVTCPCLKSPSPRWSRHGSTTPSANVSKKARAKDRCLSPAQSCSIYPGAQAKHEIVSRLTMQALPCTSALCLYVCLPPLEYFSQYSACS